jgi:ABC-type uncharacterized transport system auxiliary subunit
MTPIRAFSFLLVLLAAGCALTSKSDPTLLRYFSVDAAHHRPEAPVTVAAGATPLQLRIGRVMAASYIRDRIAFRDSSVEIGYYDDLRWTEKPESYVRRDLARALFDEEGVQEIVGGMGPTLDVDVDSFEEVRDAHSAVVQLSWQLRNDTIVLFRRTVTVRRALGEAPKDGSSQRALARALAEALDDAVDQVVRAVVPELAATTTPSPTPAAASSAQAAPSPLPLPVAARVRSST